MNDEINDEWADDAHETLCDKSASFVVDYDDKLKLFMLSINDGLTMHSVSMKISECEALIEHLTHLILKIETKD